MHEGRLKGYRKYFAKLDSETAKLMFFKKQYNGKLTLCISLQKDKDGKTALKVYPMSKNETEMLFVYSEMKKYKFRVESPFKRIQWLTALNAFTENLNDQLKITSYPVVKNRIYRKNLDPSWDRSASNITMNTSMDTSAFGLRMHPDLEHQISKMNKLNLKMKE